MANPSKQKGTAAETAVVNFFQRMGWKHAERRALQGALDKGDIAGLPGVCVEVKDCRTLTFGPWLKEAQVETANANADIGFVFAKRRGFLDPKDWFVVMDGATLAKLLQEAGYR